MMPGVAGPAISVREAYDVLMRAGEVLTGSLAFDETLRNGVQLMVPAIADWAAVLVIREDGSEHEISSQHPDPEVERGLLSIRRRRRAAAGASESLEVWRSGRPVMVTHIEVGLTAPDVTADESHALRGITPESYMIIPLRARGRLVGAFTLLSTTPGRNYTEEDCELAQTLGGRFALAIDNAQLYEQVARALEAEKAARARADVLARAGAVLDASLDYEETLRNLADVAVPAIADWCSIRTLDGEAALVHLVTAHVDPAKRELAREYERRFPPDPAAAGGPFAVLRTGVPQHAAEITDAMLEAAIPDGEQLSLVRALGLRSVVVAPLSARGHSVGVITLATAESDRRFEAEDVQLAEELGRRAGVAVDNARLYSERTRIAHTLQARLLPSRLPDIPGARLAARYRAAGELNEVGGDFYDVFARPGGWALLVGDVSGKGAEAAAATALARYTLRTAARDAGPPSRALQRLNEAVLNESDTDEFVTVVLVYAAARPNGGGLQLQVALAGHPRALVVRAGGRVDPVGVAGMLLGIDTRPPIPDVEARLAPGDAMLLYTDGVTEAGPRSAMLGEDGLVRLLAAQGGSGPELLVERVEALAVGAQAGEPRDDIALLAIAADR
jgi:serine phosphatase RsbU (regulator of sigma subunit)